MGFSFDKCQKAHSCENRCSKENLFDLGDQCKYVEPSELARRALETFKFDRVQKVLGAMLSSPY